MDSVGGLYISSLAVSSGGEVAVTGSTTCALDIQPLQGDEDVFIAKFASNGKASPYYLIGAPSLSDGSKINTEAYFLAARGNSFIALGTTDGELPGSKKVGSDDAVFIQWTEE